MMSRLLKITIVTLISFTILSSQLNAENALTVDGVTLGMSREAVDLLQRKEGRNPFPHDGGIWYSGGRTFLEGRNPGPWVGFDESKRVIRVLGSSLSIGENHHFRNGQNAEKLFQLLGPPDREEIGSKGENRFAFYKEKQLVVRIRLNVEKPRLRRFNLGIEPENLDTDI